jgi:hypothetical protein
MQVDATNPTSTAVAGAIRQAASATGTSFDYLLATAQVESGLNPQAGASTTSARGLFQFIEQTWLATMKDAGASLGYGRYANAITRTSSGHYVVHDPAMRSQILKLRNDPTANAVMAGAFTKANAAVLTQRLGRAPSESELYLAHFLGAGGAGRLITLRANQPNALAASYFPGAARANPSIFYNSQGHARTLAQVTSLLTGRFDIARATPSVPTVQGANGPAVTPPAPVPDTAGITDVFAAATPAAPTGDPDALAAAAAVARTGGPDVFAAAVPVARTDDPDVFHGLFQDSNYRTPVAPMVSQLWGIPNAQSSANPDSTLNLFKDGASNASALFGNKS